MIDRSRCIFGNEISEKTYKKACQSKGKYIKKFGDDSDKEYYVSLKKNPVLGDDFSLIDVMLPSDQKEDDSFDLEKGIILGNIRMGFGHYRISIAMASAAHALGYTPYWMDLNSFEQTTCTKIIAHQNKLYSLGSRLSKNGLFNKYVWEPLNYEGFRALSYNAIDQKNAELMAPVYCHIPKTMPVIATHVWGAQAAVHAGMKNVVNAIPDNWPMALHYAEGSLHLVQTKNAYNGYKILNGMDKKHVLKPLPDEALQYVGHYIDHELVAHIEEDCKKRINRKKEKKAMRFLLTIGGAGAQREIFEAIIKALLPYIKRKEVVLYINVGDYKKVWKKMKKSIPSMKAFVVEHDNDFNETREFAKKALTDEIEGIHGFYHENIFEAVYTTNLLMRSCDVLVTKPSELAFYPVPKLFIKRVGKHEMWGAIHSAEIGDGTLECRDIDHTLQMIDMFLHNDHYLEDMCHNIIHNKELGIYDGAYKAVEYAIKMKGE